MSTSKDSKSSTSEPVSKDQPTDATESRGGPEERRAQGAADLEAAMAASDKAALDAANEQTTKAGAEDAATAEDIDAAIAAAGAEQEARDDEVYGRTTVETTEVKSTDTP
jgi:hypothetical protein